MCESKPSHKGLLRGLSWDCTASFSILLSEKAGWAGMAITLLLMKVSGLWYASQYRVLEWHCTGIKVIGGLPFKSRSSWLYFLANGNPNGHVTVPSLAECWARSKDGRRALGFLRYTFWDEFGRKNCSSVILNLQLWLVQGYRRPYIHTMNTTSTAVFFGSDEAAQWQEVQPRWQATWALSTSLHEGQYWEAR